MSIVVVYLVILVAAFFFLVVRPQRRQMAVHRDLVASLSVGDEVVTSGGVIGTIELLDDEIAHLEVTPGVVIRVARGAIARRLEPAPDEPPGRGGPTDDEESG
jgi:preprotein translocase subunit YajC